MRRQFSSLLVGFLLVANFSPGQSIRSQSPPQSLSAAPSAWSASQTLPASQTTGAESFRYNANNTLSGADRPYSVSANPSSVPGLVSRIGQLGAEPVKRYILGYDKSQKPTRSVNGQAREAAADCNTQNFPDPNTFNTGMGAYGANDPNWLRSNFIGSVDANAIPGPNAGGYSWSNPQIVNCAPGAWVNPGALPPPINSAQWLGSCGNEYGSYYYRRTFNLPCSCNGVPIENSNFTISLDGYADNSIIALYVNGVRQTGFAGCCSFWFEARGSFTFTGPWVGGANTIEILIANYGGPGGFLATASFDGLSADTDNDGVSNTNDQCPCTAGVAPTGCPSPQSTGDKACVNFQTSSTVSILANDKDKNGNTATLSNVSAPAITLAPTHGTASINGSGQLVYTPTTGWVGSDVLNYRICDLTYTTLCSTASVTLVTTSAPTLSAAPATICTGQSTVLTATGCSGTVHWSTNQTGLSVTVAPTTTTSYIATCHVSECVSAAGSVEVTVNPIPAAPVLTATPSVVCEGLPAAIEATGCNGTLIWSTGAPGPSFLVTPSTTTVYSATCVENGCASPAGTVTLTVKPYPGNPSLSPTAATICAGSSQQLTATGCVSGATVKWLSGEIGETITVSPTTTTSYKAVCELNGCESLALPLVEVTVYPIPAAPLLTTSNATICLTGQATLEAAGCAGAVFWSTGQKGLSIEVSPTATTVYSATCVVDDCPSLAATIEVAVTPFPGNPSLSADQTLICASELVNLTASGCITGSTVVWSTGQTGATIAVSPTATTFYTAYCSYLGCTSDAIPSIEITVKPSAGIPAITADRTSICVGESVVLTATGCVPGADVVWKDGQTGPTLTVSPSMSDFYVAQCLLNGCLDQVSNIIDVTVNPIPAAPVLTADNTTICVPAMTTLRATGCSGQISWSTGQKGVSIQVTPSATTTFSATCVENFCPSAPGTVEVTVNPFPGNPALSADQTTICVGSAVQLTATGCLAGSTVLWSDSQTGKTVTVNPTATTIYNARCLLNGCMSDAIPSIEITVNPIPPVPVLSAAPAVICVGTSTELTASNCIGTVNWSTGAIGASITVSPAISTTYSAFCSLEGCNSTTASVEVTVNPIPSAPVLSNMIVCAGSSAILTPFGCAGTVTTIDTKTAIITGAFTNTVVSYTMVCTENSCVSPEGVGSITYLEIPAVPELTATAGTNGDKVCPGNAVSLSVTNCAGGSVNWSNGQFGDSVIFYPTAGNATFSVICNNGSCASEAKPILFQQN